MADEELKSRLEPVNLSKRSFKTSRGGQVRRKSSEEEVK